MGARLLKEMDTYDLRKSKVIRLKNVLLRFMSKSGLPTFSSKFYSIFRSLIHFEFIFVYDIE